MMKTDNPTNNQLAHNKKLSSRLPVTLLLIPLFLSLACSLGGSQGTAIPVGRPADFEVQTATPTTNPARVTLTPKPVEAESSTILPLGSVPTDTPNPNMPSTPAALSTATLELTTTLTATGSLTATTELTQTAELTKPAAAAARPRPVVEPDPPLKGNDWDFETDFIPWPNPYGAPCPGARVASGWTAFVENGPYGSSCFNENLYQPNVFSGLKSQEITFDFISANSGLWRTIPTKVGHRYNIMVYAKHDRSKSPIEMALGVDLAGGTDWTAQTIQWTAWDNGAEDTWDATEETVTATSESLTIFIKGFHPMADQGGKTVIDSVSITDLGLE